MKILLFGADGQLGKAFKELFRSRIHGNKIEIKYVTKRDCDLRNEESLNKLLKSFLPNLIINAAAYTEVDRAETEVDQVYAINARAPELMATFAASYGATLLHFSSDYVFDGRKKNGYDESDDKNPLNTYGASKAHAEDLITNAISIKGAAKYLILRTSWMYGNGNNFILKILQLAKSNKQLKIIHNQYGTPTNSDWLAKVSLDLIFNKSIQLKSFQSGTYHVVPNGLTNWFEISQLAVKTALQCGVVLNLSTDEIIPIQDTDYPLRATRPQNSQLNNSKLHTLFTNENVSEKPSYLNADWEEGVVEYVNKLVHNGLI